MALSWPARGQMGAQPLPEPAGWACPAVRSRRRAASQPAGGVVRRITGALAPVMAHSRGAAVSRPAAPGTQGGRKPPHRLPLMPMSGRDDVPRERGPMLLGVHRSRASRLWAESRHRYIRVCSGIRLPFVWVCSEFLRDILCPVAELTLGLRSIG